MTIPTAGRWNEQRQAARFYGFALGIFFSSRALIAAAIFYARLYVPRRPGEEFWQVTPQTWLPDLVRFDAGWYTNIVRAGYNYNGNDTLQQNVTFFPLFPLLIRGVKFLTGWHEDNAGLVIANLCIVAAIVLFAKYVAETYDAATALCAVALLSFFPTAFFFSAPFTESPALLLVIAFFLLLTRGRFALAALCAGIATATRSTCIVLLVPFAWELWQRRAELPPRLRLLRCAAYLLLASSGLWLYMAYLWRAFGDPLAFAHNSQAWTDGRTNTWVTALTLQPVWSNLWNLFAEPTNPDFHGVWLWLGFMVLLIWRRKRLPAALWLYGIGIVLFPYLARGGSILGFTSMSRYLLLAFPVFMLLADLSRRRQWLRVGLTAIFAAGLFIYTAWFTQWYWVG